MELQQIAARYAAGCPFKPGDLVTPRQSYSLQGAGEPHVVLEVPPEPLRLRDIADPATALHPAFNERLDMRVACLAHVGHYFAYWGASWQYEPWTPDTAAAGTA